MTEQPTRKYSWKFNGCWELEIYPSFNPFEKNIIYPCIPRGTKFGILVDFTERRYGASHNEIRIWQSKNDVVQLVKGIEGEWIYF